MPKLTIDIEARLAQFQDQLNGIARHGERSAGQINAAFSGLKGTLAGLGVALSAGGLISFVKQGIDAAASLDDLAEKTGASVEELSKLQQVARISGTDLGVVEGFLVKLNKALHETDDEAKGANRALTAIGLKAEDLRGLDPGQAMQKVAVAFNEFADSSAKSAAMTALTGKSAKEAAPFLKDLATETGIVARVTAEQAAQAEELQKSIRRLGNASTEASQALARELVPTLTRIVEQFAEGTRIAGGFLNAILLFGTINPFKTAGENVKSLGEELDRLQGKRSKFIEQGRTGWLPQVDAEISKTKKQLEFSKLLQRQDALGIDAGRGRLDSKDLGPTVKKALPFEPKDTGKPDKTFDTAIKGLEQEIVKVQDLTRFEEVRQAIELGLYGKLSDAQKRRLEQLAAQVDIRREDARVQKEASAEAEASAKREQEAIKALGEQRTKIAEGALDSIDSTRAWRREVDGLVEAFNKGLLSLQQLNEAGTDPRLRSLLKPADTDFDVLNRALKEGDISLEKYLEIVKRLKGEAESTKSVAQELGLVFKSSFEEAALEVRNFEDALKVVQGLLTDVARIILRKGVTEPIANAVGGSDFATMIKDALGGFFGGGKASGGPLTPGKWHIAGERGPEPIWGGGPGAFASGYGGGRGPVSVSISFVGGPPTDLPGFIAQAVPIIKGVVRGEMGTQLRPGGAFNPA